MKKFLAILAFFSLASIQLMAGQYVGIVAGTNHALQTNINDSGNKIGYKVGCNYGWKFDSGFRVEGEMAYRENHHRTKYSLVGNEHLQSRVYRSSHSISYMANVIYDMPQLGYANFTPYLGGGVGFCSACLKSKWKFDDRSDEFKERDSRFAYQGIVGVRYPITETLDLGAEYKYFCGKEHGKDHSVGITLVRSF